MKFQFDYKRYKDMYDLYQDGYSLQKIANKYRISRQRVHQILHRDKHKLREYTLKDYDLILKGFKICKSCGKKKSINNFFKHKNKSGYVIYCRKCVNRIRREWTKKVGYYKREDVKIKNRIKKTKWCEKNREYYNEYCLEYYHKNMKDLEFRKKRIEYAKKANKKRNK